MEPKNIECKVVKDLSSQEAMGGVNKIRIVPDGAHYVGYAVGVEVYKFGTPVK